MLRAWMKPLTEKWLRCRRATKASARPARSFQPHLETLETRSLLSGNQFTLGE